MTDDDFLFDDILSNECHKKRRNSGRKGRKAENDLAKQLMARFPGKQFSRVVGSGNRGWQVQLSEQAKQVLTGDLTCPENFRFCIESKKGYAEIELCSIFVKNHPRLDGFLEQASLDAARVNRHPLVCWKKDRQPTLAILREADLGNHVHQFDRRMYYGEWVILAFDQLLTLPDRFFFGC